MKETSVKIIKDPTYGITGICTFDLSAPVKKLSTPADAVQKDNARFNVARQAASVKNKL